MSKNQINQNFHSKETFSRINFLYQAAVLMSGRNNTLGSHYGRLCRSIAKKSLLQIGPNIKRNLCKKCSLAAKPAVTVDLEIMDSRQSEGKKHRRRKSSKCKSNNLDKNKAIILQCRQCGYDRKFKVNLEKDYSFWLDNPASIAENSGGTVSNDKEPNNCESPKTTET